MVVRLAVALLLLYWGIVVGMGVAQWAFSTGRIVEALPLRVMHWSMFGLLIFLASLNFSRINWKTVQNSFSDIAILALLLLAIADAILRSGFDHFSVKSLVLACFLILGFRFLFVDGSVQRYISLAFLCFLIVEGSFMAFELFNDRYLSTEMGRAAGILGNPNDAGCVVSLLAFSCAPRIAESYRLAFFAFCGMLVAFTLSRSSGLAYLVSLLVLFLVLGRQGNLRELFKGWPCALGVVLLGLTLLFTALDSTSRFKYAVADSFSGLVEFLDGTSQNRIRAFLEAGRSEAESNDIHTRSATLQERSSSDSVQLSSRAKQLLVRSGAMDETDHFDLEEVIAAAEMENSASARKLLLTLSLQAFKEDPILGGGVADAFLLGAHNTYLFAGVSFGVLGIVIVIFYIVGFLLQSEERAYAIAFGLCFAILALFSHGLLVNNPTVLAVAAGTALLGRRISIETEVDDFPG